MAGGAGLEIVVVEYDIIVLGDVGPDVRLLESAGYVQEFVVPSHLHASLEARNGTGGSKNIYEGFRPSDFLPYVFIQDAINYWRICCLVRNIASRIQIPKGTKIRLGKLSIFLLI